MYATTLEERQHMGGRPGVPCAYVSWYTFPDMQDIIHVHMTGVTPGPPIIAMTPPLVSPPKVPLPSC